MSDLMSIAKELIPSSILEEYRSRKRYSVAKKHALMTEDQAISYLAACYRDAIGVDLDIRKPTRYTEKIQWCKLYGINERKSILADKYAVRRWVSDCIGGQYLVPLLGVWEHASDIDFDLLPTSFVLKTNNATGTNILVPNKAQLDIKATSKRLDRWLNWQFGWSSFESQYLRISPRIIAEEFLGGSNRTTPNDYKFFCFNGEPLYVETVGDRGGRPWAYFANIDWSPAAWRTVAYPAPAVIPEKPRRFEEMVELSSVLSKEFPHVRVDFYEVDGKVYFGEMTFSPGSGFSRIEPDSYDLELGAMWDLSQESSSPMFPSVNSEGLVS